MLTKKQLEDMRQHWDRLRRATEPYIPEWYEREMELFHYINAQQALIDRLVAGLRPFATHYAAIERTMYPEHLEADMERPYCYEEYLDENGVFVASKVTRGDLRKARDLIEEVSRG